MFLSKIKGHDSARSMLQNFWKSGHIPHALLLNGPSHVGKHSLALEFAKLLLCTFSDKESGEACNNCPSCNHFSTSVHPDFLDITAEEGKKNISIDQIRELKRSAQIAPLESKRRVYIINEAERMTDAAQNSLLKLLEEAPQEHHLILISRSKDSILETVRSRCISLHFSRLSQEEIRSIATSENWPASAEQLLNGTLRWLPLLKNEDDDPDSQLEVLSKLENWLWLFVGNGQKDKESFRQAEKIYPKIVELIPTDKDFLLQLCDYLLTKLHQWLFFSERGAKSELDDSGKSFEKSADYSRFRKNILFMFDRTLFLKKFLEANGNVSLGVEHWFSRVLSLRSTGTNRQKLNA